MTTGALWPSQGSPCHLPNPLLMHPGLSGILLQLEGEVGTCFLSHGCHLPGPWQVARCGRHIPPPLVGRDQLFLILVLAPPPLSCSSPCPRRAVLTPLLPLSLLGSVLLSLPCSRPLVASCLLHDSSSPPVTAGPWPSRLTLWVSLSPLHCPE